VQHRGGGRRGAIARAAAHEWNGQRPKPGCRSRTAAAGRPAPAPACAAAACPRAWAQGVDDVERVRRRTGT
jgi:hypothetical protein